MRELTAERPKPLVEVCGRPVLEYVLDALPESIDSLVIVVKHFGSQIQQHFGVSYGGRPIQYIEQGEVAGPGGALFSAQSLLHDRFMVLLADDLHGPSALKELAACKHGLLVAHSETPELFGVATVRDDGTLKAIEEKPEHPQSSLISTGVMVLDTRIFSYAAAEQGGELLLPHLVNQFAADVPMALVEQSLWQPVGKPEDIPAAEAFVREHVAQLKQS